MLYHAATGSHRHPHSHSTTRTTRGNLSADDRMRSIDRYDGGLDHGRILSRNVPCAGRQRIQDHVVVVPVWIDHSCWLRIKHWYSCSGWGRGRGLQGYVIKRHIGWRGRSGGSTSDGSWLLLLLMKNLSDIFDCVMGWS